MSLVFRPGLLPWMFSLRGELLRRCQNTAAMLLRQVGDAYDESGTILRKKMFPKFYDHVQNSSNGASATHMRNLRTQQRPQDTGDIHETPS